MTLERSPARVTIVGTVHTHTYITHSIRHGLALFRLTHPGEIIHTFRKVFAGKVDRKCFRTSVKG